MKNTFYILFLLPLLSVAQIIEFEDKAFKNCILSQVDLNNNMEVDQNEAILVKELIADCGSYNIFNISDLKHFKNAEKIQLYIGSTNMKVLEF